MITRRSTRARTARLVLLATAFVAAGCQTGDGPTAPAARRCPDARVPLCTDVAHAAYLRAAVADAETRLVPALESGPTRDALAVKLATLSSRLADGDVTGSLAALGAARGAVAQSRAGLDRHTLDAADLAAIELTLTETAGALGAS